MGCAGFTALWGNIKESAAEGPVYSKNGAFFYAGGNLEPHDTRKRNLTTTEAILSYPVLSRSVRNKLVL